MLNVMKTRSLRPSPFGENGSGQSVIPLIWGAVSSEVWSAEGDGAGDGETEGAVFGVCDGVAVGAGVAEVAELPAGADTCYASAGKRCF
jgi:hypothetical protein